jgi:hypothetical protein
MHGSVDQRTAVFHWGEIRGSPLRGITNTLQPAQHCGLQLLNSDRYTQSDASTLTTQYWISGQYPIGPSRNRLHGHTGAPGSVPAMNHST